MSLNENEATIDQVSVEIIAPHPVNFLRAVNASMVKTLKVNTDTTFKVPTLMERAKAFVNKDRYIALYYVKE